MISKCLPGTVALLRFAFATLGALATALSTDPLFQALDLRLLLDLI